ncbi:MAG: ankyrin repeat domain-containing protein [Kiloniellales bacterium]|nr:ankyrin repeat domain-containing protein [Kiloniellales bacterium]
MSRFGPWLVLLLIAAAAVARAQEPTVADRALLQAAATGEVELIGYALDQGADIETRDPRGNTPLLLAARAASAAGVEMLLQRGADPGAASDDGWNALHTAAYFGFADVAKVLVAGGTPVDARELEYGNTPLLIAARRSSRGVAVALLDAGAEIEVRDLEDGNTPLINAAFEPLSLSLLSELVARGADVNAAAARDRRSPLMAAVARGNRGAAEILLAAGAAVESVDSDGYRALHFAAMTGESALVSVLTRAGAAVEARAERGDTPLGLAAAESQVDAVLALLAAGADPDAPGRDGLPPLHRAAMAGGTGAALALLSNGADVNLTDGASGNTALMLAANRGFVDLVSLLLDQGAEVGIRAKDGWTALQAAEMIGDNETAALLRAAGALE